MITHFNCCVNHYFVGSSANFKTGMWRDNFHLPLCTLSYPDLISPQQVCCQQNVVFSFVCFLACFNEGTGSYSLFPFIFEVTCVVRLCVVLCYVVRRQVVGMRCDREVPR